MNNWTCFPPRFITQRQQHLTGSRGSDTASYWQLQEPGRPLHGFLARGEVKSIDSILVGGYTRGTWSTSDMHWTVINHAFWGGTCEQKKRSVLYFTSLVTMELRRGEAEGGIWLYWLQVRRGGMGYIYIYIYIYIYTYIRMYTVLFLSPVRIPVPEETKAYRMRISANMF
jgi:hypothetical protein